MTQSVASGALPESANPPDFDTRPGEPLRSTLPAWIQRCESCGYCAGEISRAAAGADTIVASEGYREWLLDASLPALARPFLAFAFLLEKVHQPSDAGWSALHSAWACDDAGDEQSAARCRARAIELWQRGKGAGQLFCDDMGSEFALVTDLYRRMGDFDRATVTCAEGLDLDDQPPVIEAMLRRQMVLIRAGDTAAHNLAELRTHVA